MNACVSVQPFHISVDISINVILLPFRKLVLNIYRLISVLNTACLCCAYNIETCMYRYQYSQIQNSNCAQCPTGHWSAGNSASCSSCPAAKYLTNAAGGSESASCTNVSRHCHEIHSYALCCCWCCCFMRIESFPVPLVTARLLVSAANRHCRRPFQRHYACLHDIWFYVYFREWT